MLSSRHVPGVFGDEESADDESFADGLLEYPQYTRPAEYRGMERAGRSAFGRPCQNR